MKHLYDVPHSSATLILIDLLPLVEGLLKANKEGQNRIKMIKMCIQNTIQDIEMVQSIQELNE